MCGAEKEPTTTAAAGAVVAAALTFAGTHNNKKPKTERQAGNARRTGEVEPEPEPLGHVGVAVRERGGVLLARGGLAEHEARAELDVVDGSAGAGAGAGQERARQVRGATNGGTSGIACVCGLWA